MLGKNGSNKKRILGSIAQGAVTAALVTSLGPVAGVVAPTLATTAFGEEFQTAAVDTKAVATYDAKSGKIVKADGASDADLNNFLTKIFSVKVTGPSGKLLRTFTFYNRNSSEIPDIIRKDGTINFNATEKDSATKLFSDDGTYKFEVEALKSVNEGYPTLKFDVNIANGKASTTNGKAAAVNGKAAATVYRLYNPFQHLRLYTTDKAEYDHLVSIGWNGEGAAWQSPAEQDGTPVYRLYNQYNGEHLYTTDKAEYDNLVKVGWSGEDVAFYSAKADVAKKDADHYTPVKRFFNPYITGVGSTHHYTLDANEQKAMTDAGWQDEGVAFYAIKPAAANQS